MSVLITRVECGKNSKRLIGMKDILKFKFSHTFADSFPCKKVIISVAFNERLYLD